MTSLFYFFGWVCCQSIFSITNHPIHSVSKAMTNLPAISVNRSGIMARPIMLQEMTDMVPMEIVDSANKNPFKKFGIHRSGHCYSCDLAILSFKKKQLILTNVCDSKQVFTYELSSLTISDQEIKAVSPVWTLRMIKEPKGPVYRLQVDRKIQSAPALKIVRFYAPESEVKKFSQHDCGDFEG